MELVGGALSVSDGVLSFFLSFFLGLRGWTIGIIFPY